MKRMAMILGFGLVCALAGCGPSDQRQQAAKEAKESTQVTVESATHQDVAPTGDKEHTQVTVDSADEEKPAKQ